MSATQNKRFLDTGPGVVCAAIFANFLWASASPCIKLGYQFFQIPASETMSIILFAGMRFFIAGILVILSGSLMQRRLLVPRRDSTHRVIILALAQTVIQYVLFYMGLSTAPGYKGSITSPANVFFAVLLSTLVLRQEKLTLRKFLGCVVGFAGVILVNLDQILVGSAAGSTFHISGEGFLILSTFSNACSAVLIKRFSQEDDPVTLSGYQFSLGGLIMIAIGLLGGGSVHPSGTQSWLILLYLAFISAAAYTVWSLLLQRHPVSKITIFTFTNPIFGVFLSAWLLGEGAQFDLPRVIAALVLVTAGILLVNAQSE